ncbi:MAG: biotin synthase BioB, partial [Bradymonadia bacterium]
HVLQNARSGKCPEDCRFCSQSAAYNTGITDYPIQTVESLVQGARKAKASGAARYCMVTATRGPSKNDLDVICDAVHTIKTEFPELELCTSLGLLTPAKAKRLKDAGVDRYNHNLETSANHFETVVTTHGYQDRVDTIKAAHDVGMQACCGGIVGMGETLTDQVELAFALRDLEVESIPVNFLDPRPGTPMGDCERLTPHQCLVTLAMFRFVNPSRDVRVAGGREANLGAMQSLALYPANSIFTEGYLTTLGNQHSSDHQMIRDAGFNVLEVL